MKAFQRGEAAMRGTPSDCEIETKKPAADVSARASQTRFDDDIMPVFCPTCQTSNCNSIAIVAANATP